MTMIVLEGWARVERWLKAGKNVSPPTPNYSGDEDDQVNLEYHGMLNFGKAFVCTCQRVGFLS